MRDPHVEYLRYDAASENESVVYEDPGPLTFSNEVGVFTLKNGELVVRLSEHFPDEDSARHVVAPLLRSWEINADLTANLGQIRFKFKDSKITDRNPPAPGETAIGCMQASGTLRITGRAALTLKCSKYPDPPAAFTATTEVQLAHARWVGFRAGREPLQSMAYFVLTLIERTFGGRQGAATSLSIDSLVLNKIGELSSTRGASDTVRKAPKTGQYVDLTAQEQAWLEAAVKHAIQRLGEHTAGGPLNQLAMADLPKF